MSEGPDSGRRLQFGGQDQPTPGPDPAAGHPGDDDTFWGGRRAKHRAKKARIAAMSRPRRIGRRALVAGTWLLGFIAACMVAVIILYYQFTDVPRPETRPLPQVATIQYADGTTIAKIGSVDRTIVHLQQVPAHVRWAVLAAEDRGFYTEPGVSIRGTLRAALSDVRGGSTQGGSGITQQYVKNAYLDNAQTLTRKLKELMIAVKLSRDYAKDQILEFYLNTVYFGRGAYGIQAAAQAFFGVDVERLSVAQGALLGGLLRAPGYYDPATNPAAARSRWQYVLDGMVTTNHLTAAERSKLAFPATKKPKGTGLGTAGWKFLLTNAVLADLSRHGISASEVSERGLQIRTTIDRKAQDAALHAIGTTFANLTKKQRNLKNALVAVNPRSGGVLAYYGGTGPGVKGYDGTVDYKDWASRNANPPGSSFKPYTLATVLTQTLEQTPGKNHVAISSFVNGSYCRTIDGTKICNDPGDRTVSSSTVKLALAMKYSLNTTFDQLAFDAGPADVAATAHAMGIPAKNRDGQQTLVGGDGKTGFGIGIGDYPVTVLDQANGFATLANGGVRNDAYLVERANASDGEVVYRHKAAPKQAIDKRVANDVTMTLKPIAAWSNDALANGRQSAAKTGTEGIGTKTNGNSDAWMVGFTPHVSAAVWVGTGYRNKPIYNSAGQPLYGSNLPGKTWKLFMDTYLKGTKHEKLPDQQQIDEHGTKPAPTPTFTSTPVNQPTDTPKPTFAIRTGFPSTSASSATRTTTPPPPLPRTSTSASPSPSASCTPGLLHGCNSASSSSPHP